jgi:hypothetical protein
MNSILTLAHSVDAVVTPIGPANQRFSLSRSDPSPPLRGLRASVLWLGRSTARNSNNVAANDKSQKTVGSVEKRAEWSAA